MAFIRYAGFSERRCIARDTFGLYGAIVTLATYTTQASKLPEALRDVIIKALRRCVSQHPVLRTVICDAESEQPRLEAIPRLDLNRHLLLLPTETDDSEHVPRRLLERILNEPLGDRHTVPQWRLYVLPIAAQSNASVTDYKVAFAASHALTDGMSGLIFHSTFLEGMQESDHATSDSGHMYETQPSDPSLSQSLEQVTPLYISWSYLLKTLSNEFLPKSIVRFLGLSTSGTTDRWLGAPTRPSRPATRELLQTAARITSIPGTTVQKVLQSCRRHDARLTGLITRLAGHALARALAGQQLNYSSFAVQTAIDLRRCIPGAQATIANYFSAVPEFVGVEMPQHGEARNFSDDDWIAVRRSTELLKQKSSSPVDQPIALLKYVGNISNWILQSSKKPPADSYTVNNLGAFENAAAAEGASSSQWTVKDIAASQSASGVGEPLSINVASVKGGPLSLVVCWEPGALGVNDEDVFVADVCAFIRGGLYSIGNA